MTTFAVESLADRYFKSDAFKKLFASGMKLVEDTAAYLDGPGRAESKRLDHVVAIAYATESLRLTTRLMQMASWLIAVRAMSEGEMTVEAVKKSCCITGEKSKEAPETLPTVLRSLIARSNALMDEIVRLNDRHVLKIQTGAQNPPEKSAFTPRVV
jgi:regulator of CtrA degradation